MARAIVGRFCERRLAKRTTFAKGSFRWAKVGANFLLVGCPRGKWLARGRYKGRPGRCTVGTRAFKILAKSKGPVCCPRQRRGEKCVVK